MAEILKQTGETLLSLAQMKKLESCQEELVALREDFEREVHELTVLIDRHYFNRENGFLDEQQNNLREIVGIQSRMDSISARIADKSSELKKLMMEVQKSIHGETAPAGEKKTHENEPVEPVEQDDKKVEIKEKLSASGPNEKKKTAGLGDKDVVVSSGLINRSGNDLLDSKTMGGELSIRLLIDSLKLREPANRDILYQLNNSLKDMLYKRKLIGYSATSLVFGKNTSLEDILEVLLPVFSSDALKTVLMGNKLVSGDEISGIKLACSNSYELIYRID